jgi:4-amino-4-deoxy-L-arabinose transferase-like glycosyltransferase
VALWRSVFPSTDLSMRLLSLAFGMASLAGIYLVGRVIAGRRVGLVAAAIAALYPHHWIYSTDLRPYAMFLAFSAFSTWAFLSVIRSGKGRHYLLLVLFTLLNLYTHYFAVFLLAAQALVFLLLLVRYSRTGRWTPGFRNRQMLYAALSLLVMVAAYAPWAGIFRRIVAESVVEGRVVGAGRRVGRGVTLRIVRDSVLDALGKGPLPVVLQGALLAWGLVDRKLREGAVLLAVTWVFPFILLLVWKPAHFIAPKYFVFAYPVTVAMVAAGLSSFADYLSARGIRAKPAFCVLAVLVAIAPLLPGQHEPYVFRHADWNTVIGGLERRLESGDRLCFPGDSKTYAMIMQHSDEDFLKRYPVILWRPQEGVAPFVSLDGGTRVWFLRQGTFPGPLADGLGGRLTPVETWHIYPETVRLYLFTAEDAGGAGGRETGGRVLERAERRDD